MTRLPSKYHHPFPDDVSLERALDAFPGQAVSLRQVFPFWDVCVRRKPGTTTVREYFVTERQVGDETKPKRITVGYKTENEALEQALLVAKLWQSTHVHVMPDVTWGHDPDA